MNTFKLLNNKTKLICKDNFNENIECYMSKNNPENLLSFLSCNYT